jgi:hypothetical protein
MSLRGLPKAWMLSPSSTRVAAGPVAITRFAVGGRASCGVGAGVGRITQKRWASNQDQKPVAPGERPFYLQLQETIHERVQKEKAEQIQIQSLQQRTARGQFWATITGTTRFLSWACVQWREAVQCKTQCKTQCKMQCKTQSQEDKEQGTMDKA